MLVSVWGPTRWELPLTALSQYTTPVTPKENEWIDRPKTPVPEPSNGAPAKTRPSRRPPSRYIMRHVLRARAKAAGALAEFFAQLEAMPGPVRVRASGHLARACGGGVLTVLGEDGLEEERGWRHAREVIEYLRQRGAKIATLNRGFEGQWAAVSDGEMSFEDVQSE